MFSAKQLKLLGFFADHQWHSTRELSEALEVSAVTITREIGPLIKASAIERKGKGRSTQYRLTRSFAFRCPIDLDAYFSKTIEDRIIQPQFNFDIFELLKNSIWTPMEVERLDLLHHEFVAQKSQLSPTLIHKEWERVTIEFSWKSSAIEGNTYSLIDTENLIKEGIAAIGKTKTETQMILNHKQALDFVREYSSDFKALKLSLIEDVHRLLVQNLGVTPNFRRTLVGITGTKYRPLDNQFQIKEALEKTCELINREKNIFAKSLLSILMISYIQPFEDGNKRTARLISNAILNAHQSFPLSFRSTDESLYKKSILVFYEINNVSPMKEIFLNQSDFSVKTYFRSSY